MNTEGFRKQTRKNKNQTETGRQGNGEREAKKGRKRYRQRQMEVFLDFPQPMSYNFFWTAMGRLNKTDMSAACGPHNI